MGRKMAKTQEQMELVSRRDFIRRSAIGAIGAITLRRTTYASDASELTLYVGTFTSSNSEGIYIYRMDQATGELKLTKSVKSVNPSFLAIDRNKRYLYAVNEVPEFGGKRGGAVSAYA